MKQDKTTTQPKDESKNPFKNEFAESLIEGAKGISQRIKDESKEVKEGFTGGEWQVSKDGCDIEVVYGDGDKTGICAMYAYEKSTNDAALISQAKNMYYALLPFFKLGQEVLDIKEQDQIIYEFNGAKITTQDLKNVLTVMFKANPKS